MSHDSVHSTSRFGNAGPLLVTKVASSLCIFRTRLYPIFTAHGRFDFAPHSAACASKVFQFASAGVFAVASACIRVNTLLTIFMRSFFMLCRLTHLRQRQADTGLDSLELSQLFCP